MQRLYHNHKVILTHILFAGGLICVLLCNNAWAECSRSDVNYYLEKGFSREQVAAICSSGSSQSDKQYQPYEDARVKLQRQERAQRAMADDIILAKTAIAAWDIELTPQKLEYTRKFCVSAGKTSEVEGRTRACPEVRYRIYFDKLKVRNFERKYFFVGQREIEVIGKVQRKRLSNFDEYPSELRRELTTKYNSTIRKDGTFIPIRKDTSINRIITLLKDYAGRASRNPR